LFAIEGQNGEIVVYSEGIKFDTRIREYPPLPRKRCPICHYPNGEEFCRYHKAFEFEGLPRNPNFLYIVGYYELDENGNPKNQLTVDIRKFKNLNLHQDSINILSAAMLARCLKNNVVLDQITYVPSHDKNFKNLFCASKIISNGMKCTFLNPEKFLEIKYGYRTIKEFNRFEDRFNYVKEIFQRKCTDLDLDCQVVGILDDVMHTGCTLAHFSSILKSFGARETVGLVFGRVLGRGNILPKNKFPIF